MKLHNCIICVKVLGQSRAGFLVVSSWSQVPSNHFLIGYKALYEMEPMPGALYWPKLLSGLDKAFATFSHSLPLSHLSISNTLCSTSPILPFILPAFHPSFPEIFPTFPLTSY